MMKLDKRDKAILTDLDSNEGEQTLLSSNESGVCSPSLEFLDTSSENVSEDEVLQYLAEIVGDIYIKNLCSRHKPAKQ